MGERERGERERGETEREWRETDRDRDRDREREIECLQWLFKFNHVWEDVFAGKNTKTKHSAGPHSRFSIPQSLSAGDHRLAGGRACQILMVERPSMTRQRDIDRDRER